MVRYELEEVESGSDGGKRCTCVGVSVHERERERRRSPRTNERSREGFDLVAIAYQ